MDSKLKSMIPLTYNLAVKTIAKPYDYLDLLASLEYVERNLFRFSLFVIVLTKI